MFTRACAQRATAKDPSTPSATLPYFPQLPSGPAARRKVRSAAGPYGEVCLLLEAISSGEGGCRVTRGHFHNSAVRILRGRAARIEQQHEAEAARTLLVLEVSLSLSLVRSLIASLPLTLLLQPPSYPSPPSFQTFASLSGWLPILSSASPFSTHEPSCRYLVPSWCNTFLPLLLSSLSFSLHVSTARSALLLSSVWILSLSRITAIVLGLSA